MIERFNEQLPLSAESVARFRDKRNQRVYTRILGGMAWPTKATPGFLLVLALDRQENPQTHKPDIWTLHEYESADPGALMENVMNCVWRLQCAKWYGNPYGVMGSVYGPLWNRTVRQQKRIHLINAPAVERQDALTLYLELIRQALASHCKTLQIGGNNLLREHLAQIPRELPSESADDYPAIAALGYALAALHVYQHGPALFNTGAIPPLDEVLGY